MVNKHLYIVWTTIFELIYTPAFKTIVNYFYNANATGIIFGE